MTDDRTRAIVVTTAALAASNLAIHRTRSPAIYLPWATTLTAGLVALARRAGCSFADLGLDPASFRPSMRVGVKGAVMVAAGYGAMVVTRMGGSLLQDHRVTSLSTPAALRHLALRIPFATVAAEEVAFRGVLPALLATSQRPEWVPGAVASLMFGMWHVLPSHHGARANQVAGVREAVKAGVLEVLATTAAGALLQRLRRRTGHLAAPAAVHLATNTLGFLVTRTLGSRR